MAVGNNQQTILDLLRGLKGIEPLKELFWTELNYDRANALIPTGSWTDTERAALAGDPLLFATAGQDNDFHILYCRLHSSNQLHIADERILINRLIRDHLYGLFVFSDASQEYWHFVNVRNDPDVTKRRIFRRISVSPEERLRTAAERMSLLDIAAMGQGLFGLTALDIQTAHDDAFNVEAVTKQFFDEYCAVFGLLQKELRSHVGDAHWAHDYAQSFLNRLMFLYFVQRKGWVGGDREFVSSYWNAYRDSDRAKDTFFAEWLKPLFFEAFNNQKSLFNAPQRDYMPSDIRSALLTAPYLNGGLFRESPLDDPGSPFLVSDMRIDQVLRFLDRYNFTIAEDSPLDQEVAVDPEMIGNVYESLVNVSEETDERGDAGIFYTPRTEIDLMCRLALVDNLSNRIGKEHRKLLYELVFALEPDEKSQADAAVQDAGQWEKIAEALRETTVVDPACGSGSFLVGMLHVLDDLQRRAQKALGIDENLYARRKRIVGQSLYGVDVMEWACHVAELRLWLSLIIDAQFTREELAVRAEPLLPNFTFNIRCGDSLVEEVAGIDLAHLGESTLSPAMKRRITELRTEKAKFYNCDGDCKFRTVQQAQQAERSLFNDIIQDSITRIQQELSSLGERPKQASLIEGFDKPAQKTLAESESWKREREAKQTEIDTLRRAQDELSRMSGVPFVWRIAFAEVFHGDRGGFDIVVGNPPYVMQESIADPAIPRENITVENKREYKAKLALTTYRDHPAFFGYKPGKGTVAKKINAKSDLYVYFYFRGLHLLNRNGSFIFITSNSWLDVGYGAGLQEFLLRQCHAKLVIDNQAKRSFLSAEVNTVICLLSAPKSSIDAGLPEIARFVMFKVPFEQVISSVVFEEIEETLGRRSMPEYRVQALVQSELLERGIGTSSDDEEHTGGGKGSSRSLVKVAKYTGDKWGGKYLRASDVYWTILDKVDGILPRLDSIAGVRRGITSGCNEFFHLDRERIEQWGIEEQFLKLLVKSPRDYYSIRFDPLPMWLFWCQEDRARLSNTAALKYIEWGEQQGFHNVPSCRSRRNWYSLRGPEYPDLLWPSAFFERHIVYECPKGYCADKVFYTITGNIPTLTAAFLNSAIVSLFVEVEGYQLNHGGIFVTTDWLAGLRVLTGDDPDIAGAYSELASRDVLLSGDEHRQSDRRQLDALLLGRLGFSSDEISTVLDEIYDSIDGHVAGRIHKARREVTKSGRMRLEAAENTLGIWSEVPASEDEE